MRKMVAVIVALVMLFGSVAWQPAVSAQTTGETEDQTTNDDGSTDQNSDDTMDDDGSSDEGDDQDSDEDESSDDQGDETEESDEENDDQGEQDDAAAVAVDTASPYVACSLSADDRTLISRFKEKMDQMAERRPWKIEFFAFRLGHLLRVLPEGDRVWCIVYELHDYLLDLTAQDGSDDETRVLNSIRARLQAMIGTKTDQREDKKNDRKEEKKDQWQDKKDNRKEKRHDRKEKIKERRSHIQDKRADRKEHRKEKREGWERLEIEVEFEDGMAYVEVDYPDGDEDEFVYETDDKQEVIDLLAEDTNIDKDKIVDVIEYDWEDEDDDDDSSDDGDDESDDEDDASDDNA